MFERHLRQVRRETMLFDVTLTVFSLVLAYGLRWVLVERGASPLPYLALLSAILPLWVFLLTFFGAYQNPRTTSALKLGGAVVRAVATGLVLLLTFLFVLKVQYVSRVIVFTFSGLDVVALAAVRSVMVWRFRRSHRQGESLRRVLIIGSGSRARRLTKAFADRADLGARVVGLLDPDPIRVGNRIEGSMVLGTLDDTTSVLKNNVVDEVILAIPRTLLTAAEKVVRACEEEGVKVGVMADLFDVNVARMSLDAFGGVPLLTLEPVAHEEWEILVKRVLDLALAMLAVPLLLPLMAVIALAIRIDSRGPVLFTQDRVGLNKRVFRMFKFRTMVDGGERLQESLERLNEAQGPVFKIAKDPRVTRVGRVLRQTSLDELPQILNVIRGQMSLVGPRPLPLRDVKLFDRGVQRKRFSVKPGITGVWQISGRSNLSFTRWLEMDLWYIENWSLSLDLKLLVKTVPAVLRGVGAA